jgi:hypothetical protein
MAKRNDPSRELLDRNWLGPSRAAIPRPLTVTQGRVHIGISVKQHQSQENRPLYTVLCLLL